MKSRTTAEFREQLSQLPTELQERADEAFERFQEDPSHPGLEFKRVHPSRPIYSARISLNYRALAVNREDTWIWFWIGSHSEYDKLLNRI